MDACTSNKCHILSPTPRAVIRQLPYNAFRSYHHENKQTMKVKEFLLVVAGGVAGCLDVPHTQRELRVLCVCELTSSSSSHCTTERNKQVNLQMSCLYYKHVAMVMPILMIHM